MQSYQGPGPKDSQLWHRKTKPLAGTLLVLRYRNDQHEQADILLEAASNAIQNGMLLDGKAVPFGWSSISVTKVGNELHLCEPDFARDPFGQMRDDVSVTIDTYTKMFAFVEDLEVVPVPCSYQDTIQISKDCFSSAMVYAHRFRYPSAGFSGWYIGELRPYEAESAINAKDFNWLHKYEWGQGRPFSWIHSCDLVVKRPALLSLLWLPPGFMAICGREGIRHLAMVDDPPPQRNDTDHADLATRLASGGDRNQALIEYDQALMRDPMNGELWYMRGNHLLLGMKLPGDALNSYDHAVKLWPAAECIAQRALCLWKLNRKEEALGEIDQSLLYDPQPMVMALKACLLRRLARHVEAQNCEKEAHLKDSTGTAIDRANRMFSIVESIR